MIPRRLLSWLDIELPSFLELPPIPSFDEWTRQHRHDETERAHYAADHADELRDRDRPGK